MSDLSKVEFRYFGYWDVPRVVVAQVGDRVMFLNSRFDDIADDFGPFDVYEMGAADVPAIGEALKADDIDLSKARFLGTVPATVDLFDPTRHHYIDLDLVRSRLRPKGQWPTPSYPWEHIETDSQGVLRQLVELGALPTDDDPTARLDVFQRQQQLLEQIVTPVDDTDTLELVKLFPSGDSDAFGLAWTLVHLIETAPGWPIDGAVEQASPYWANVLMTRAAGRGSE